MPTPPDWDPRSPEVLADPIAAFDELRARCPVPHSEMLGESLMRHDDVLRALNEPEIFSNRVSTHWAINSMDPPEHTRYRRMIDRYFVPERVGRFESACRKIGAELVGALPATSDVEVMSALANPFAASAQCAFLGWPDELRESLLHWVRHKNEATASGDREAVRKAAAQFEETVAALIAQRREADFVEPDDVTGQLVGEVVDGRPLSDDEIAGILRNWTVGELETIAASVGIVAHYLATHRDVQDLLRDDPALIAAANDEILRIHAPLTANRRVTARPVTVGGRDLPAGAKVTLVWASAQRDEGVFGDPDEFRLDRDPELNLLYGKGIHACPGASLARMELRSIIEVLLENTTALTAVPGSVPVAAPYPAAGYDEVVLRIER